MLTLQEIREQMTITLCPNQHLIQQIV